MYRLLIVDDEVVIVKGLSKIFEEESKYEFEIYKAYSTQEALGIMKSVKIDILLSDIHMPGQDGFELAQEVKKRWKKCKIIFLTGYNEFEYIYKATNDLKAGYILKSEDDDEILGKIEEVVKDIERSKQEQLLRLQEVVENKVYESFIKAKCLESILLQNLNEKDKIQLKEVLDIDLDKELIIYIGRVLCNDSTIDQIAEIVYKVKKVYYEELREEFYTEVFEYQRDYIVCLLQPKEVIDIPLKLIQISEEYQEIIMELCHQPISVIFSKIPVRVEQINEEFSKLYRVLLKETEIGVPKILEMEEEVTENEDELILKLERYIERHIGEELTLTKLASVIHLNPSYLSRYYRKMTGGNLSDFIKVVKIEKSKILLIESNKKIGEIAMELGFESASYFCKVFKKCIGVSPVDFRRGK
ncbi:response regulator transcription factor [Clostridium sp.]|uniref:response regulator transcription factor n=1 Tax=Clostridium sp. TaxID=1506 RepID=UPI003F4186AB